MTDAAVASEIHQPLDRLLHLAPQVALDLELPVDNIADADLLVGAQIVAVARGIDLGFGENFLRRAAADSIDIGQRDFHPLVMRQFYSGDACHMATLPSFPSSLSCRSRPRGLSPDAACGAGWRNTGCAPRPGGALL